MLGNASVRSRGSAVTALLLSVGLAIAAVPAAAVSPALVAEVFSVPHAVPGSDGETHLVYELKLTNTASVGMTLTEVAVFDPDTQRGYAGFLGTSIAERLRIPDRPLGQVTIPPGQWGAFLVHVAVPPDTAVPAHLSHVLVAAPSSSPDQPETMISGRTEVERSAPVVLGPPLRGGNYIAGDGCCDAPRHVMALLKDDEGRWWNAQRFAIDWELLDDENRLWVPPTGRPPQPQDYHIYGREWRAVADGVVVAVVKGEPDQPPQHPDVPRERADGNHLILKMDNGVYAMYAHAAPNSITVDAGERVRRGDVLGKVGNSGNSLAPHLHFQVMDRPSSLEANGLPYVFERFAITGFDAGGSPDFQDAEDTGQPARITAVSPPTIHSRQLPLNVTVVEWPD